MAYRIRYFGAGEIHVLPSHLVFPHRHVDVPAYTLAARRRNDRRKANTVGPRYKLSEVAERDDFRCHLCGGDVDMSLPGTHAQGPTADHLVPVSRGGGDEAHNIALSHRRCNVKRGVRPLVSTC